MKLKLNPNFRRIPWWEKPAFVFWAWLFCHVLKEHYWHYFRSSTEEIRECFWCGTYEIEPRGDT